MGWDRAVLFWVAGGLGWFTIVYLSAWLGGGGRSGIEQGGVG